MELASARQSMGASRISSSLFDLKLHSAATSLRVTEDDDGKYILLIHSEIIEFIMSESLRLSWSCADEI